MIDVFFNYVSFQPLQTCFDWFFKGQCDLEPDTQSQMFTGKVLKLDPSKLTMKGTLR